MRQILFVAALLLGITYASRLVEVQAVAQVAGSGDRLQNTYQLVEQTQGTRGHRERVSGPQGSAAQSVIVANNFGQSTRVPPRAAAVAQPTQQTTPQNGQSVNGGLVHVCPCGPNCTCPDPAICKAGQCQKNYIILFTAKWCRFCPTMKAVAEKLEQEGYIVHFIDADANPQAIANHKIEVLPFVLVMDKGKEVARYSGITRAEQIKKGVKTRVEQIAPEPPAPPDYNLIDKQSWNRPQISLPASNWPASNSPTRRN